MNKECTTTIRGIAILIIIMGHVGVSGFDYRFFNPFGGIGVAMFLFLSGYGLTESYSKNGFKGFWKKKILRILIPYLVWIPIYHIVMSVSPLGLSPYLRTIPRYWFIEYLVIAYILFYFVFKYINNYAFIITIFCVLGIISFITTDNLRAEQSFSFLCGILLSLNKPEFEKQNHKNIMIIVCILFLIGATALLIKQSPIIRVYDLESIQFKFLNLFIKLPIGIALILFTYLLIPKGNKPLLHIGNFSYELYLCHIPFFMAITGSVVRLIVFIIHSYLLAYLNHAITQIINRRIFNHG